LQQLVASGIRYIVVEILDACDRETIRRFAQQVVLLLNLPRAKANCVQ
jgi:hypothetical protein